MRRLLLCLALCSTLLLVAIAAAPAAAQEPTEQCFSETGFCISGAIRDYWNNNGGAEVFGYPTSDVRTETVEDGSNIWKGPVQWFQRDRLEDHTVEGRGVLAGRLGALLLELKGTPWEDGSSVEGAEPGCRYFAETRHSLCEPFLSHWEDKGGLARFGFPITEQFSETTDAQWSGTVQYFERRRMEHHEGDPQPVWLGLLGDEVRARLPSAAPAASGVIVGPQAGETAYTFEINVNSERPETIQNIDVFVYDPQNVLIHQDTLAYQPGENLTVDVPKNQLKATGEYTIKIFAKDQNDKFILTKEGQEELAAEGFGHTVEAGPVLPTAAVSIEPIKAASDGTSLVLPVTVQVTDESNLLEQEDRREHINCTIQIFDQGLSILSYEVRGLNLDQPQIDVPLAADTLRPGGQYDIVVKLKPAGLDEFEASNKFTPKFPAAPGFWATWVQPVISNPITVGGVIFVIALVAVVLIYTSRPSRKGIPPPIHTNTTLGEFHVKDVRPPKKPQPRESEATVVEPPARRQPIVSDATVLDTTPVAPHLKVLVVQTVDPAQHGAELSLPFPCVVGRVDADLVIPGDKKVSRRHAEIAVERGKIIIKDLGSANGTALVVQDPRVANGSFSVKTQLERGGTIEWDNDSLILLGRNTVLKIEPLGDWRAAPGAPYPLNSGDNKTILGH